MLVKFYDQDGSGGGADKKTPDKEQDSKAPVVDPPQGGQPKKEFEKQPVSGSDDYKAKFEEAERKRAEAEVYHKRFQSETTEKLQELAKIKEVQSATEAKRKGDDDLTQIDEEIKAIDEQIPNYKSQNVDTTSLRASRRALELEKKRIQEKREEDLRRDTSKKIFDGFKSRHEDFTDYDGLTKIIEEHIRIGEPMGLEGAYKIWNADRKLKEAESSKAINDENSQLGKKAIGQDGKPIPSKGTESFSDKTLSRVWGVK